MEVNFNGNKLLLKKQAYNNGRIALELIDVNDNEPFCVATINLPNVDLKENEVAIKDYSENTGILDCLIEHGIVSKPIDFVRSGFVEVPICELLKTQ